MPKETIEQVLAEKGRLQRMIDELQVLNDLSSAMSSTMDVDKIMAQIITKSISIIGVMQGAIMLVDRQAKDSFRTMIRSVDEECGGRLYKLGTHLAGWMIINRKPLLVNDIGNDERFKGLDTELVGICNVLCVPMILRDELVGVINLINKNNQLPFTDHDQSIMSTIATQVASFLVHAKTFEETEESKEKLQKETIRLKKANRRRLWAGCHHRRKRQNEGIEGTDYIDRRESVQCVDLRRDRHRQGIDSQNHTL